MRQADPKHDNADRAPGAAQKLKLSRLLVVPALLAALLLCVAMPAPRAAEAAAEVGVGYVVVLPYGYDGSQHRYPTVFLLPNGNDSTCFDVHAGCFIDYVEPYVAQLRQQRLITMVYSGSMFGDFVNWRNGDPGQRNETWFVDTLLPKIDRLKGGRKSSELRLPGRRHGEGRPAPLG